MATDNLGPHSPWLTVEGIAEYLNVSKETIYRWLERETIPAHRMGKLWRFKPSEVDEWVMMGGAAGDSKKIRNGGFN
jgi:excisionase family DNA binding protein